MSFLVSLVKGVADHQPAGYLKLSQVTNIVLSTPVCVHAAHRKLLILKIHKSFLKQLYLILTSLLNVY